MVAHPIAGVANRIGRPAIASQGVGALLRRHGRDRNHTFGGSQEDMIARNANPNSKNSPERDLAYLRSRTAGGLGYGPYGGRGHHARSRRSTPGADRAHHRGAAGL